MSSSQELRIPTEYNYVACFLTLRCNLNCDYCINNFEITGGFNHKEITGKEWAGALNRLVLREDIPITIQGGEPSLHPDYIYIINSIRHDIKIDILTNLTFDINEFIDNINPSRINRKAPYAPIRVTYHANKMDKNILKKNTLKMMKAGFRIGVYGILHPDYVESIKKTEDEFIKEGIDFRTKEFLGLHKGNIYGDYHYPDALGAEKNSNCLCRTSELIIGPDASIFKCHHDFYNNIDPIGNMRENDFKIEYKFRECSCYGSCNPCDIKLKTNRLQVFGHTSAEIKDIER